MFKKIIFFSLLFCAVGFSIMAQGQATRALNLAEDDFENGRLDDIPSSLEPYFKSQKTGGFSKEEKIRAHRLITLVHMYSDNEPAAEDAFVELLKADPEHPPAASDPKEFHFLHEKFNTDPIFRIGFKVGVIRTEASPFTGFGSANDNAGSSKTYTPKIGFGLEANFEYQLPYNLELVSGVGFSSENFEVVDNIISTSTITYTLTETQTWIKLPAMVRYNMKLSKGLTPYVYGGYSLGYLLGSTVSGDRSEGQALTISGVDLLSDDLRNELNHSLMGGIGIKFASKTNFFVFESRYTRGITNIVNSGNRFANQNLLFGAGYVDDNFSENSISFSFGYIMSFYKPKKLSEKKYNKKLQKKLKKSENE